MVSRAGRLWLWIQSHPFAADAVLAAILLGAAFVSSSVEIENIDATDPSYRPPSVVLDAGDSSITAIVLSLAVYSAAARGRARWRNWVCAACLVAVMAEPWREVNVDFPPDLPNMLLVQILALLINFVLFCAIWAPRSAPAGAAHASCSRARARARGERPWGRVRRGPAQPRSGLT